MTIISRSIALMIGLLSPLSLFAQNNDNSQRPEVIPGEVHRPVHFDTTPRALRDLADRIPEGPARGGRSFEPGRPFAIGNDNPATPATGAPVGVNVMSARVDPKVSTDGVPIDTNYRVSPPDTTGDLGPNHYVQWVNLRYAVYTVQRDASNAITGFTLVQGFPKNGNVVFQGMGNQCETSNDGDPLVQYDQRADRWVITQFAVTKTPYMQCIAVSKTPDPTGEYYRYAYSFNTDMNDFPKMGIWNDTYVISYNMFKRARTFAGGRVCGYDRLKMLAGLSANQVCATTANYASLLPADVEATITGGLHPTAGSAVPLLSINSTQLLSWKFTANFTNGTGSLTGPTVVPGVTFSRACAGGACIPQPGTTNKLDSLADRLNYRLSYRKFATHESMVVNHPVAINGTVGLRWYELRNVTGTPTVYQQGTYSPDSTYRWMGSAAMDKNGGIAIGYNISSSTTMPGISYAYRGPADTLGALSSETVAIGGGGSQTGTLTRWGDYSTISVDPVDGCTMVFTTEYLKATGSYNWATFIHSFKPQGCQ